MVCQASALPLSYGPINRIREQAKCPKLVPKSTPNLSFPRKSWGPKPLASLARRWLGVSTDLVRGGQGVCWDFFTEGGETGIGRNCMISIGNDFSMISRNIDKIMDT